MLKLESIGVRVNGRSIITQSSLSLDRGEIGCLLGPSGCGKSTTLLSIAGFYPVQKGRIVLDGKVVSSASICVPPEKRTVGMMFQELALFPHLTVGNNIIFGLNRQCTAVKKAKLQMLLETIRLEDMRDRYPHELSGGQKQRAALARALAPGPKLLLLDEPFSSIDSPTKEQLMADIKNILRTHSITTLLVTHDHKEAFFLSDMLGVMGKGRVLQWGKADSVYHHPNSVHIAQALGSVCVLEGNFLGHNMVQTAVGKLQLLNGKTTCSSVTPSVNNRSQHPQNFISQNFAVGQKLRVILRPEDIIISEDSDTTAKIEEKTFLGAYLLYDLRLKNGEKAKCVVPNRVSHAAGTNVGVCCVNENITAFAHDGDDPHLPATFTN